MAEVVRLSVDVHDRARAQVAGVHRTLDRAGARDVRGRAVGADAVVGEGYSDVLSCQIRVRPRRRAVWESRQRKCPRKAV